MSQLHLELWLHKTLPTMSDIQDTLPAGANAVYTGFWHDWDRGKVLGATLTLKDRHAVALLAALAVLVTFAETDRGSCGDMFGIAFS